MSTTRWNNGYEGIYRNLLPRLAVCDLTEAATRLGYTNDPGGAVVVPFCGQIYTIDHEGVRMPGGRMAEVNNRIELNLCSLLAYYILSPGAGAAAADFVPSRRVTGIKIEGHRMDPDPASELIGVTFADRYEAFAEAARLIGGEQEPKTRDGARSWLFRALPKIHVRIVFHEADEEFPAEVQVLLTSNCLEFLGNECLSYLCNCFAEALVAAAPARA